MYTIKQASRRSRVPVPLLRAWERRYGVVYPARASSGYRMYDDDAIAVLRAMRQLIDEGWSPSAAARHLRDATPEAVDEVVRRAPTDATATGTAGETAQADETLRADFVAAAAALDEPAYEAILDEMFARGSFEHVASELVMPALVALGEGWASGAVDVAAEHAASNAVLRRLGASFLAAGRPGRTAAIVLVGLPPGARHELGALAFATAARRAGIGVRYLGADLPVDDWLEAAGHASASAAVLGVVTASDVGSAERVAAALREARPRMIIAFGGRAATEVRVSDDTRTVRLPDDLHGAVEALRSALAEGAGQTLR